MTKRIDATTGSVTVSGVHGNGRSAGDTRASDATAFPLVLSRIASLGVPVLIAAAIGRLLLVSPTGFADTVPSLLLVAAAAHLALLATVLWLLAEPAGDVRRSSTQENECTGAEATEATPRTAVRGSESDPPTPESHSEQEQTRAA